MLARAGAAGTDITPLAMVRVGADESRGLLPSIDRCFREASLTPDALREPGARIAVSIGPGGYTSVRIAVTAAKLLSEATGAFCVPVPTARVVAARVTSQTPFAVGLASKRESAWFALFAADGAPRCTLGIADEAVVARLSEEGVGLLVIDGHAPKRIVELARQASIRVQPPVFDPGACALLGATLEPIDPLALEPIYPREPEAVTKWRALKASKP